jgi:hypothetical protein
MNGAEEITNDTTIADVSAADEVSTDAAEVEQGAEPESDTVGVDKVRREARNLRERLKVSEARTDELARRLHTELARASGKLADVTDLAFDAAHLDDADTLTAAIDSLLEAKPHLRSRVPSGGNVGQGAKDNASPPTSLLTHLKALV